MGARAGVDMAFVQHAVLSLTPSGLVLVREPVAVLGAVFLLTIGEAVEVAVALVALDPKVVPRIPDDAANKQWFDLILKHPWLYLRVRWEDFRWVFATPVIDFCLPVYVGVDAPIEKMAPLRLDHRFVESDAQLNNYATWFFDTPAFRHWLYAGISLVLTGLFLWRRQPADIAIAGLQLAGIGFAASFFIISIACDYRYLYFTDLAALTGLIYAAIDPPMPWRRKA